MPSVATYKAIKLDSWEGGLNLHADASRLEDTELSYAMNVRLGPRGEVQMRTGYTQYDDGSLTDIPSFLYPWRSFAGDDFLIATASTGSGGGSVWYGSDDTFTDSTKDVLPGTTLPIWGVGFAGALKKLYVSSKNSSVISFDGTTWADVTTIPRGKILFFRHGRLFSINTLARPSGVYFSALNDAETVWDANNYVEAAPDDGYEINCADIFGDDLILFKDQSIWQLSGRSPSALGLYKLDSQRGSVSPRAFSQLRGRLFFYDRDSGIWAFDGSGFELVSQPINNYMLAGQNYDLAYQATAYTGEDRVYFSIPWFDASRHTFVYHGQTGAWTEYDSGFAAACSYLDTRYLTLPGVDGIVYADTTSSLVAPSATPLVGTFRTGWFELGGPGLKARVRRIEMSIEAPATTEITMKMYRDHGTTTPLVTRTITGGGDSWATGATERIVAEDGWGGRLHSCMFEFSTNDYPFQLNNMTVFYTGGADVRGER